MVGNDVVDLLDLDTDPRRPRDRFDARVCRPVEQRAIRDAADPSRERWCHWAAKEAAYKLLRKRDAATIFSPVRFEVELAPAAAGWIDAGAAALPRDGRVTHGEHEMMLSITCEDDALHALALWTTLAGDSLLVGHSRLPADDPEATTPSGHSQAVRQLANLRVGERLGVSPGRLSITRRERIPEIRCDGALFGADLSLSHHGRVVAFACRLPAVADIERLAS